VPKGCYELIEFGVYSWAADKLYARLRLTSVGHALIDLQFCLANEGVEKVMKRIFANRPQFVGVLWVPRLRTLLVVPSS
jgi:hypothetical protein